MKMNGEQLQTVKPLSKLQLIGYGIGDLAGQFIWTFLGSYLTVYYTDIVGLAPLAVSVLMLVARLWDAINDPMMGALAERTRSKFGRFRPWILFGSPILAVFGVFVFTAPFGNGTAGVIWASVTYIIAGMLYTAVGVPYAALMSVMSTDTNEINQLSGMRTMGMYVGQIIVSFLSSGIILFFSQNGDTPVARGYTFTAALYGIIAVILYFIVFKTSREVVKPLAGMEKVPIKTTLKNVVGNKYLMLVSVIMLLQMLGYMGRISVTSYYVIYCIGSFTLIGIIMGIPCVSGAIGALLAAPIMKKLGKKKTLILGMLVQAVALIAIYLTPFDKMTLLLVEHFIYGFGGFAAPAILSWVADSVDYQEDKTGVRTDGTAFATYGFASKAGTAIGSAVGVMILQFYGYVANQQQTPRAMHGINVVVNLLPAIAFIIGAVLCFFWKKSDREFDEIRTRLQRKREDAAKNA